MCNATHVVNVGDAQRSGLRGELGAHALRCFGIAEKDRAERDVLRAGGDELEYVAS